MRELESFFFFERETFSSPSSYKYKRKNKQLVLVFYFVIPGGIQSFSFFLIIIILPLTNRIPVSMYFFSSSYHQHILHSIQFFCLLSNSHEFSLLLPDQPTSSLA
jgi:hypothetical protein